MNAITHQEREACQGATLAPALKLGEINARLGLTLTSSLLEHLGFNATAAGVARMYPESDWPAIKAALIRHIEGA